MSKRSFASAVLATLFSVSAFADGGTFKVSLDALNGFTDADKVKIQQAAEAMSQALSSEALHQAVLSFTFEGRPQFSNNSIADASGATVTTVSTPPTTS